MKDCRGVVLIGVLFALVALAAIAGALGFVALQESRLGANRLAAARASEAARGEAVSALAGFDPAVAQGLTPGASAPALGARLRRLSRASWAFEASALDPARIAERRVVVLARADPPLLAPAALVSTARPAAGVAVDSVDAGPPGWSCTAEESRTITTVSTHLLPSDSALWALGVWNWPRLAAWAATGWASDSLAIRYAGGGVTMTGGRFLGVLVVDGDLVLRANAQLIGVVFVRGRIVAEGLGGAVFGVAVARGAELGALAAPGSLRLTFSSCAAGLSTRSLAPLHPVPERSLNPSK